jgi:hypothetical protein
MAAAAVVEEEMGGVAELEMGCGHAAEVEWAAAAEEKEEMEMGCG